MLARSQALALLAAAPAIAIPSRIRAQTAIPLHIGACPFETYSEPYYAQESGIFARAGLDITISPFPNGASIAQALIANALDVGMTDPIQVANAYNHNVSMCYFAPGVLYTSTAPTSALCVAKNGPIRTAKDLEGKTIAVNGLKSTAEFATREWMRANGADPAKAQFVEITFTATVAAIQRGTIAAAIASEPALSSIPDDVRALANVYDAIAKTWLINSYIARREWLPPNAEAARRFARAIAEAARWSNTHHAETAPMLAKVTKLEVASLNKMTRATFATSLNLDYIQPTLDIALRYNAIDKPVNAASLIVQV
jgi:NitT/TauT family transport system substrate-binding protein